MSESPASVIRKRGSNGYTQVPNLLINDKNLSLRAKGVWVLIESKPNTWVFRESNLISTSAEGRDAFRSAVKELIDAGWLRRFQERNSQGHFVTVYEIGYSPLTENPSTEKPSTVEPSTDNQAPYKDSYRKTDEVRLKESSSAKKVKRNAKTLTDFEQQFGDGANASREYLDAANAYGLSDEEAAYQWGEFLNYYTAKGSRWAGDRGWKLTWQKWCRTSLNRRRPNNSGGSYRSAAERNSANLLADLAAFHSVNGSGQSHGSNPSGGPRVVGGSTAAGDGVLDLLPVGDGSGS